MAHTENIEDPAEHNSADAKPTNQKDVLVQQKLPDFLHKTLQSIIFVYISVAAFLVVIIVCLCYNHFKNSFRFENSQIV